MTLRKIISLASRALPDKVYISLLYFKHFHKFPNFRNPKTFNEKLQWLKLYDRKPEYHKMVDKYEAKKYVADIIGEEYIIPTYGVWDTIEEIEWDKLPEQFVIKTTGGSGGADVIICKDIQSFDKNAAIQKLKESLAKPNVFWYGREWPYKGNKNRIIAEKYMEDSKTKELRDYKFFCMDGVAKALFIATERQSREEPYFDFFDMDFRHLDIRQGHPNAPITPARPETFEEMKNLCAKISKRVPHVRCDFYEVNGKAYFGELTFYSYSGIIPFEPNKVDFEWGEWITLPNLMGGGYLYIKNNIVIWLHAEHEAHGIKDYKFYCFNGEPKFLYVSQDLDNHETARISFLTMDWKFAPFGRADYQPFEELPDKPSKFNEMISLSRKLSADKKYIRVDLYEVNGKVYFSELTFYPSSGFIPLYPTEWDAKIGSLI